VVGDRVLGDRQRVGDLAVGHPPPNEGRHLMLAAGERVGGRLELGAVGSIH
jgi:hypothetical protein